MHPYKEVPHFGSVRKNDPNFHFGRNMNTESCPGCVLVKYWFGFRNGKCSWRSELTFHLKNYHQEGPRNDKDYT